MGQEPLRSAPHAPHPCAHAPRDACRPHKRPTTQALGQAVHVRMRPPASHRRRTQPQAAAAAPTAAPPQRPLGAIGAQHAHACGCAHLLGRRPLLGLLRDARVVQRPQVAVKPRRGPRRPHVVVCHARHHLNCRGGGGGGAGWRSQGQTPRGGRGGHKQPDGGEREGGRERGRGREGRGDEMGTMGVGWAGAGEPLSTRRRHGLGFDPRVAPATVCLLGLPSRCVAPPQHRTIDLAVSQGAGKHAREWEVVGVGAQQRLSTQARA